MPSISKIRLTNVVYDNGNKRYIDTTFQFDGYNGILLLENGAGKTVFVQTALQAILPRKTVAQRKIQQTLQLSNNIAHIAVEWIISHSPRRYALTAVSLFMNNRDTLASQEFAMEYAANSTVRIDTLPFTQKEGGKERPSTKEELATYFRSVANTHMTAKFFSENDSLLSYHHYIESQFKIIPSEWNKIASINETEGGVEAYFENCRTTNELIDKLLIPTVEEGMSNGDKDGQGSDNGFAELFEKQRDHFKKQRILETRIAEMTKVIHELSAYTDVRYEQYKVENELLDANRKLKALYEQVSSAIQQTKETYLLLQQQEDSIHRRQYENTQAEAAWQVAAAEAILKEKEGHRQTAHEAYEKTRAALVTNKRALNNLIFAKSRYSLQKAMQQRDFYAKELAALSQDAATQELESQLQENSAFLHHSFLLREQYFHEQLATFASQRCEIQEVQTACQEALQSIRVKKDENTRQIGEKEGTIHEIFNRIDAYERELFPDSLHREPKAQYQLWKNQLYHLTEDIKGYEKNIVFYTEEKQKIQHLLPAKRESLASLQTDKNALSEQLVKIQYGADIVMKDLSLIPSCANVAITPLDLYQREEFLRNQLGDLLLKEEAKLTEIALTRRKARRFLDDYESIDHLTADPLLEEKISQWQDDFIYIRSGANEFRDYCRSGSSADTLYQAYPLWAASIVTTADSVSALYERLQRHANEFTSPIFILTDQEVRQLVSGTPIAAPRTVAPAYWQHLLPDDFSQWVDALKGQAALYDKQEQEQQHLVETLRHTRTSLIDFYSTFSFSEYQELQASKDHTEKKEAILQRDIHQLEEDLTSCDETIEKSKRTLFEAKERSLDVQQCCQKADDYFSLQQKQQEELSLQSTLRQEGARLANTLQAQETQLAALQDKERSLIEQIARAEQALLHISKEPYYSEVQAIPPKDTAYAHDVLTTQRQKIKNKLDGIHENRGRIEATLESTDKEIRRLHDDISKLKTDSDTPLDETYVYPEDGEQQERLLRDRQRPLRTVKKEAENVLSIAQHQRDLAMGSWEQAKKHYFSKYDTLLSFTEDLEEVKKSVAATAHQLEQELASCHDELKKNKRSTDGLGQVQTQLDRENIRLQFTLESIKPAILPDHLRSTDYTILSAEITPLLANATDILTTVEAKRNTSQEKKTDFIRFCEKNLKDEKMRRRIVDGIRSKETYEEFLSWKEVSANHIQKIITLSEEERKEHYSHIDHMIEYISLHLQEVCKGLVEIASKTRIKVGTTTKDIYTIHVPTWQDSDNRLAIRSYLNTITERLASEAYKDDSGHEDTKKIKASLEKLLRTQQLLNQILGNNVIKVKCRKATSEDTFSDRPYSWEASNQWSGGEMWSKNMALFLGCLNYLSEKKSHIPKGSYNTRVVIADNPFGKASSDHVLDPIFFIAQQLGFQIIALTAHEDGNFIRKYFPVVYSCRFASLSNGKGKVLQPEKEIKTAFFEEHDPQTLVRLNDYEEMGLFD